MENNLSLKIKIEDPEVLGKIDIPKNLGIAKYRIKKGPAPLRLREKVDSGWAITFGQIVKNYKRTLKYKDTNECEYK